jgi:hypothetical protein
MSQPGKPAPFVVIPEFVVKPDCIDAFLALAQDVAIRWPMSQAADSSMLSRW